MKLIAEGGLRLLVVLLAFFFLCFSLLEARTRILSADILFLSEVATRADGYKEALLRSSHDSQAIIERGSCASDIVDAGVVVLLRGLDYVDQDQEFELWREKISLAKEFVSFGLRCDPQDGSLWLRLAMIYQATGESPARVAELARLSQEFAPAEEAILVARMAFWNRSSVTVLELGQVSFWKDVRTICIFGGVRVLNQLPPPSKSMALFWRRSIREIERTDWCG